MKNWLTFFCLAFTTSSTSAVELSNSENWRDWVRSSLAEPHDEAQFGLVLPKLSEEPTTVTVLVHGFNSRPERCQSLLSKVREQGQACGAFAYPNDYRIGWAARLLSKELKALAENSPKVRIALVTHSMGGLVARACVEDPLLDPGNVTRLVMVAPPSTGSRCAEYAAGADLWEHWIGREEGSAWQRMRDSVVDGLGEAAFDLRPDSEFFTKLSRHPRNPRVKYTVLLGTGGCVTDAEVKWARRQMRTALEYTPVSNEQIDEIDACLSDLDEIIVGKGDGIVAVKRGRLSGVEDTHLLPFSHVSVADDTDDQTTKRVQRIIAERVE